MWWARRTGQRATAGLAVWLAHIGAFTPAQLKAEDVHYTAPTISGNIVVADDFYIDAVVTVTPFDGANNGWVSITPRATFSSEVL